ncbi:hypothetical protein [Runella sp.]|uniref:hypothetical protein n=1 Tax=Runella sp. TaxID=1960881 RepID=UPI003D147D15
MTNIHLFLAIQELAEEISFDWSHAVFSEKRRIIVVMTHRLDYNECDELAAPLAVQAFLAKLDTLSPAKSTLEDKHQLLTLLHAMEYYLC